MGRPPLHQRLLASSSLDLKCQRCPVPLFQTLRFPLIPRVTHTHTLKVPLRFTVLCSACSSIDQHPLPGCQAMGEFHDINEDDLVQIDWDRYSSEPIERYLSVNHFREPEECWTKFVAYAVYQGMMLTEDGSKQHHDQLVELLRSVYPVMLYGCWVRDYIFTDAMRGLTTIHPSMFGHLNVLVETPRPKAAIVVADSILCFLNGKRSRTAYEPVDEFKLAFGTDWDYIEVKVIWGADLSRIIRL